MVFAMKTTTRNKIRFFIWCVAIVLFCSLLVFLREKNKEDGNTAFNIQVSQGYIHLTDDYDTNGTSLTSFLSKEQSVDVLEQTLDMLKNEKDYFFLDAQDIYIEKYNETLHKDLSFIVNNDKSVIEKDVAPIKSLQGDSAFFNDCHLKNDMLQTIDFGKYNNVAGLKSGKPVSVILGYGFRKYLRKGDIFNGTIYDGLSLKFVVEDFLKKNSKADNKKFKEAINEFAYDKNLDYYVLIPNLYLNKNDKYYHKNYLINLCQRCEGILFVKSKKDCKKKIGIIKKIRERTGFQLSTYFDPD